MSPSNTNSPQVKEKENLLEGEKLRDRKREPESAQGGPQKQGFSLTQAFLGLLPAHSIHYAVSHFHNSVFHSECLLTLIFSPPSIFI